MPDLWQQRKDRSRSAVAPLAVRMRPRTLREFAGQLHILGPGKLLRRMLEADTVSSMIFHGPPGTGKTTLAELAAHHTKRVFVRENAALVGVKRIREVCDEATRTLELDGTRTILFLDEIHRFTKSQQDVLLSDVERGLITLIGATTENPLFAVNSALVSRSTLFRLEPLSEDDVFAVLRAALADNDRGYGLLPITIDDDALRVWAVRCDGDARRALGALEIAVESLKRQAFGIRDSAFVPEQDHDARGPGTPSDPGVAHATNAESRMPNAALHITLAIAQDSIQQKAAVYAGAGDDHYDAASAMIKSLRGSDPDAAIYWIARMLDAGEDPRFIARRMAILASEDIGNADPRAILIASACFDIVTKIGMPEARITLAQTAAYLALCPKSNASYAAIEAAMKDVREGRTVAVPMHIKDGMVLKATLRSEGDATAPPAQGYQYAHTDGVRDDLLGMIGVQDYLGVDKRYYEPTDHGFEKNLRDALERARAARATHANPTDHDPRSTL